MRPDARSPSEAGCHELRTSSGVRPRRRRARRRPRSTEDADRPATDGDSSRARRRRRHDGRSPHWTEPPTGEMPRHALRRGARPSPTRTSRRGRRSPATPRWRSSRRRLGRRRPTSPSSATPRPRVGALDSDADRRPRPMLRVRRHDRAADRSRAGGDRRSAPERRGRAARPRRRPQPPPLRRDRPPREQPASPPRPAAVRRRRPAPPPTATCPWRSAWASRSRSSHSCCFTIGPGRGHGARHAGRSSPPRPSSTPRCRRWLPPGHPARHRRVRRPAARHLLAGRGRDPARARS